VILLSSLKQPNHREQAAPTFRMGLETSIVFRICGTSLSKGTLLPLHFIADAKQGCFPVFPKKSAELFLTRFPEISRPLIIPPAI